MKQLDFEAKKDVRLMFVHAVQRKVGSRYPIVQYISDTPQIMSLLCSLYESQGDGLNSGPMLRECINFQELAKVFLNSDEVYNLIPYSNSPTFDLASDAFATLRLCLTKHKKPASEFLENNYEKFFHCFEEMLTNGNYATKRQYLQLLSELLLDRSNFCVMGQYITNPHYL